MGWAVLLFLAACGLLAAINLVNTRDFSMEMTNAAEQNLSAYIHDNAMTSLNELSTLLNQLESPAIMTYSGSYANLRPADEAEAMRRDLADILKIFPCRRRCTALSLSLGITGNQAGFSLNVDSGEWIGARQAAFY